MAKLLNQAVHKGGVYQAAWSIGNASGAYILTRVPGVQENNIRLIANVYLYVPVINSELNEFFALFEANVRQRRSGFRVPFAVPNTSIVRVISLYDFPLFELWITNSGVPA